MVLALGAAPAAGPALASGGSGGGGGGTGGGSTYLLQGYLTDIDPDASTTTIGTSYHLTGVVVTADTKVTLDGVNCTADDLALGDYASAPAGQSSSAFFVLSARRFRFPC